MDNIEVGERIREARKQAGFSQKELANKSNIAVNTLSLLERGQTSPTVVTLQKLATQLGVDITFFFTDTKETADVVFTKGNRLTPNFIAEGELYNLCPNKPNKLVQPLRIKIKPGAKSAKAVSHDGYEFAHCLEGEILFTLADKSFLMERGDSIYYNANIEHRWQNLSITDVSQMILIMISAEEDADINCDIVQDALK